MSDNAVPAPLLAASARSRAAREGRLAWMLMLPASAAFVLMLLLPTLAALALAFTDYEMGAPDWHWIGLANFREMTGDPAFRQSLRNTIVFVGLTTPAAFIGGLGLALAVERCRRGRAFFRAVFFLPVVSLTAAMAAAWQYLLHPMIGPVNALLHLVGIPGPLWLSSAASVLGSLAGIATWGNIGFNMVLFMAGLTTIPRELYAAAEVDGARSGWAKFWLVTWPLLGPTSLFVLTITLVRALTSSFDLVTVMTQGGPDNASAVLLFTLYQQGFTYFRLGYAAAITLVFLVIVVGVTWAQNALLDRRVHYG